MSASPERSSTGDAWLSDTSALVHAARSAQGDEETPPVVPGYAGMTRWRRGGQGVVYRATQCSTGRTVAIKLLHDDASCSAARRRRFEQEIAIAARLRHPGIVQTLAHGVTEDGRLFLVMEWLDGSSLHDLLRDRDDSDRAAPAEAAIRAAVDLRSQHRILSLFADICDAVDAAHREGIVHRDLKPSNVIVVGGRPRILDFGVSRLIAGALPARQAASTLTASGQFVGSLPWASPEQLDPAVGPIDARTDVYALGVILYKLLSGRLPFDPSRSLRSLVEDILGARPRPPVRAAEVTTDGQTTDRPAATRGRRSCVAEASDAIVLRCLAKAPHERYATAGDLAADVRRVLRGGRPAPRAATRRDRLHGALRRARGWARVATFSAVVMVLASAVFIHLSLQANAARRLAEVRRADAERQQERAESLSSMLTGLVDAADPALAGRPDSTVRALVASWRRTLRAQAGAPADVRAPALVAVARTAQHLGLPEDAEALCVEALQLIDAQNPRGSHSADGADAGSAVLRCDALGVLTRARHSLGRLQEAEECAIEAVRAASALRGEQDPLTVHLRLNLATLLGAQGRLDEAEAILKSILDAADAPERPDEQRGVASMRLAEVMQRRGRFDEADVLFRRAHDELVAALGTAGLPVADCLECRAALCILRGSGAEAAALAEQALSIFRSRLGPSHWRCAGPLITLADALAKRSSGDLTAEGDPELEGQRLAILADARRMVEHVLPEDHPINVGIRARLSP